MEVRRDTMGAFVSWYMRLSALPALCIWNRTLAVTGTQIQHWNWKHGWQFKLGVKEREQAHCRLLPCSSTRLRSQSDDACSLAFAEHPLTCVRLGAFVFLTYYFILQRSQLPLLQWVFAELSKGDPSLTVAYTKENKKVFWKGYIHAFNSPRRRQHLDLFTVNTYGHL